MCAPAAVMGIGSFAQGAFGALSGAAQARARNRAAVQNYEWQIAQRKKDWYQQLSVWGAQRNKYLIDINESDLAMQRGYSQAQVGLNQQYEQAAQRNEGALIKYLQQHGQMAAKGRTGRSADRISSLELGALGRARGRTYAKLTQSKEIFKHNVETIRQRNISNRSRLESKVAFAPIPDLAPPPPQMENESAVGGLLMAGVGGLMSYADAGGSFSWFKRGKKNQGSSD
tara:strand:+ start:91 stop:774 length:684 start_codon:yes stop_codon:yes gene_type:complete